MGALLALAYHYVGEAALERLMEGLMSTNLLAQVLAESMEQGLERGLERGRAEGLERGLQQGRAEEARVLLRRYLETRFGAIPPALDERIAGSDADTLTALFERALAVTALADL
jgi:flagellar biosynthesis/type III secretory pathway protein FliH